ncbi:MAG: NHL repeat-containing protein [Rectinema subterraneum]
MNKLWQRIGRPVLFAGMIAVLLAGLAGCDLFSSPQGSSAVVFAVDSKNGNVYEIDADKAESAAVPLVSTKQNATGKMIISGTKAFLAVASWQNTKPGLYWFDLSSKTPAVAQIGQNISAQYICIASSTKGYVSSADWGGTYDNAVYPFNPSSPSAGFGAAVSGFDAGFFPQDVAYVDDGNGTGRVFVADNGNGKVYRLNAEGTAVDKSFAASAGGTTGLLAGEFDSNGDGAVERGVFVANSGGYDANWNPLPGSIDFIPLGASSDADVVVVQSGLSASALAFLDATHIAATSYGHTWLIDLSKPASDASRLTEIKTSSGASFGSMDIAVREGYAYVPDGAQTVYRFGLNGPTTAIPTGKSGEMITNIAVRQ